MCKNHLTIARLVLLLLIVSLINGSLFSHPIIARAAIQDQVIDPIDEVLEPPASPEPSPTVSPEPSLEPSPSIPELPLPSPSPLVPVSPLPSPMSSPEATPSALPSPTTTPSPTVAPTPQPAPTPNTAVGGAATPTPSSSPTPSPQPIAPAVPDTGLSALSTRPWTNRVLGTQTAASSLLKPVLPVQIFLPSDLLNFNVNTAYNYERPVPGSVNLALSAIATNALLFAGLLTKQETIARSLSTIAHQFK